MREQYGVRWSEVNRRDGIVVKEKFFEKESQLDRFSDKVAYKDNFVRFEAWLKT